MTGPTMTGFSCGGDSANASARDSVDEVDGLVRPQPNLNVGGWLSRLGFCGIAFVLKPFTRASDGRGGPDFRRSRGIERTEWSGTEFTIAEGSDATEGVSAGVCSGVGD